MFKTISTVQTLFRNIISSIRSNKGLLIIGDSSSRIIFLLLRTSVMSRLRFTILPRHFRTKNEGTNTVVVLLFVYSKGECRITFVQCTSTDWNYPPSFHNMIKHSPSYLSYKNLWRLLLELVLSLMSLRRMTFVSSVDVSRI